MVWTPPATFATGRKVTAADWNSQVRDNMGFLYSAKVASVGAISTANIPSATWTLINYAFEVVDTVGAWSAGAPSRFTPPVAGYYLVTTSVAWSADATETGYRSCRLWFNGTTLYDQDVRPAMNATQQTKAQRVVYFNGSTDFVETQVYHTKGSDHALSATGQYSDLIWIGA